MSAGFVLKGLGMNYSEVNYNGTGPIMLAMLRNEVQLLNNTPAALKAHFESGQMVPIAALGEERFPELPQVPTVREAGYKGFFPILWNAVYAPKGTPRAVVDRIAADIMSVSTAPDMKDRIEGGFSGFIPKSTEAGQIGQAVEAVLAGEIYTPPGFHPPRHAVGTDEDLRIARRVAELTPQQFRVLGMLCSGLLNKQIAYELDVSEATVKAHVTAILRKLGVTTRTQAVLAAGRLAVDRASVKPPPEEPD